MHSKKIGTVFTAGLTHFFLVLFIQALPLYRQPWELAIDLYLLSSRISGRRNDERSRGFGRIFAASVHFGFSIYVAVSPTRRLMPMTRKIDIDDFLDSGGTIAHDENAIGKLHGFFNIVRDKENCLSFRFARCAQIGTHFFVRNRL